MFRCFHDLHLAASSSWVKTVFHSWSLNFLFLSDRDPFRAHREHMRQMMRSFSEPHGGAPIVAQYNGREESVVSTWSERILSSSPALRGWKQGEKHSFLQKLTCLCTCGLEWYRVCDRIHVCVYPHLTNLHEYHSGLTGTEDEAHASTVHLHTSGPSMILCSLAYNHRWLVFCRKCEVYWRL